jgi:hypothetical protein
LGPIADHRHYGRAVWIDPVILRAITISWNYIGIPVRLIWPYHHDKPLPWFTRLSFERREPLMTPFETLEPWKEGNSRAAGQGRNI